MDSRPTRTGGGWFQRRAHSFAAAARGLWLVVTTEPNARIHALATLIVVGCGSWFRIEAREWCAVVIAMSLVWIAEALNSAIEALADRVEPEQDPLIARAKDMAAGGVLFASIAAAGIGCIVFLPRICPGIFR
jgi:diacylglycerol kinase (ATP)